VRHSIRDRPSSITHLEYSQDTKQIHASTEGTLGSHGVPLCTPWQAGSDTNTTQCKVAATDVLSAVLMAVGCVIILYLIIDQLLPRWNPAAKQVPHQT